MMVQKIFYYYLIQKNFKTLVLEDIMNKGLCVQLTCLLFLLAIYMLCLNANMANSEIFCTDAVLPFPPYQKQVRFKIFLLCFYPVLNFFYYLQLGTYT